MTTNALMKTMAERYMVPEQEMMQTLKATAFKGNVTDAQMTALLIVANQYGLNPWTKEIYAYPDSRNGIVPIVGVDGWARIINEHPQFDGLDFLQDDEQCTCIIYRKDRAHPIKVTEYMAECKKAGSGPWGSHPKRMLRHKALIQCARLAFGYVGIYDEDEADRIVESGEARVVNPEPARPALEQYSQERFNQMLPLWKEAIESGKKSSADVIASISTRAILTEAMKETIANIKKPAIEGEVV